MKFIKYLLQCHRFYMRHDGTASFTWLRFMRLSIQSWRLVTKAFPLVLALCLASCESSNKAEFSQVPEKEAAENLKWFRAHYLDAPLTRALNEQD